MTDFDQNLQQQNKKYNTQIFLNYYKLSTSDEYNEIKYTHKHTHTRIISNIHTSKVVSISRIVCLYEYMCFLILLDT